MKAVFIELTLALSGRLMRVFSTLPHYPLPKKSVKSCHTVTVRAKKLTFLHILTFSLGPASRPWRSHGIDVTEDEQNPKLVSAHPQISK